MKLLGVTLSKSIFLHFFPKIMFTFLKFEIQIALIEKLRNCMTFHLLNFRLKNKFYSEHFKILRTDNFRYMNAFCFKFELLVFFFTLKIPKFNY